MQVAKLLALDEHRAEPKWKQIVDAWVLTARWGKAQVFEYYLNRTPFRGEVEGIDAASRLLLDRTPGTLTLEDSVVLAALLRSPQASETRMRQRACGLLATLSNSRVSEDCPATRLQTQAVPDAQSFALSRVASKLGIQKTTLSLPIQIATRDALREQLSFLSGRSVSNAAALVVDHHTGEVLAYVDSISQSGEPSSQVDSITSFRQAGSSLKPFLYALALEKRYLTASSQLKDEELELESAGGIYRPKNHDRQFHGAVSLRVALASSLNIPAVRTLELVGEDRFKSKLSEAGFVGLAESSVYGPSLALGSAEIRLWDLVQAYAALAEGGSARSLVWTHENRGFPESKPIVVTSPGVAAIVRDILIDRDARALGFGSDTVMDLSFPVMVKTGTTHEMRDNWCVASSARYTVGVWVGNLDGSPMRDVSGLMGAAPVAARVLNDLHHHLAPAETAWPAPPSDVVRFEGELYLSGTEPTGETKKLPIAGVGPRFEYPVSGMRVAWDPEIPQGRQLIFARVREADLAQKSSVLSWRIGNEVFPIQKGWSPKTTGSYRAELLGPGGRVLDQVQFSVLGRSPATAGVR